MLDFSVHVINGFHRLSYSCLNVCTNCSSYFVKAVELLYTLSSCPLPPAEGPLGYNHRWSGITLAVF